MANTVKRAILQKIIEDTLCDLMVKSHVDNIVYSVNGTTEVLLSTKLAEILTKTNALGTISAKNEIAYADLATALKALINGKANMGTTLTDYGIVDAYTKAQVDALVAGAFTFKGVKNYQSELPATGNKNGDVWQVKYKGTSGTAALDAEFAWNGSEWVELGTLVDLSAYVPSNRTINGKPLSADVTLAASDIGAALSTHTHTAAEVGAVPTSRTVNGKALSANIAINATDVGAARILYGATTPVDLAASDLFIQTLD